MSWHSTLKGAMDIFVEQEAKASPTTVGDGPHAPAGVGVPNVVSFTFPTAAAPSIESTDQSMISGFRTKLMGKITSPIVTAFLANLETLREFIPEEDKRIKAALKQMGGQVSSLLDNYKVMEAGITKESQEFIAALEKQKLSEVTGREGQISNINVQLDDLTQRVKTLSDQKANLATEIVTQKNKLAAAENSFQAAVSGVTEEIRGMSTKIKMVGGASGN